MVAYADLILPDTTYLERWDCISLLDRPISGADGPADAIRQPVVRPDRDVRAFQSVLIDIGARLKLPGFVTDDGAPRYPGGYPDYIVNHERMPGIGSLAGFRGDDGKATAAARRTRSSSKPMSPTAASTSITLRPSSATTSTPTRPISTGPRTWASSARRRRWCSSFTSSRCRNSGWRRAATARSRRRTAIARGSRHISIRSRSGIRRSTTTARRQRLHDLGHHAAADAHLPLVGHAQRLDPPDHRGELPLHEPRARGVARHRRRRLGLDQKRRSAASRAACG